MGPFHELPSVEADASYDLTVVGSGLSSTFTMIRLAERLLDQPGANNVRALVVEKSGDFFGGIPYGVRSGVNSLIITPLGEFLPPAELELFQSWLQENAEWILDDFKQRGGPRSTAWLAKAEQSLLTGDCADFHVPRYLWGRYLADRFETVASEAQQAGVLECSLLSTEITSISRSADGFRLEADGQAFGSKLGLLALGMPPTRKIFGGAQPSALLVEDPYSPDLDSTMDAIADAIDSVSNPAITVIGANAGSLEMLYMLGNTSRVVASGAAVTVISPQGRLPERFNQKDEPAFSPTNLPALLANETVAANDILKAVELDLADARSRGLGISDSLPTISAGVGALLGRLNDAEMRVFVSHPGIEIGRLQRRAGDEYCDGAVDLAEANRLTVEAGSFIGLEETTLGAVDVAYETSDGELIHVAAQHVVVNCAGSSGLEIPNQSALLESLLTDGLCRATPSGNGLLVDDTFAASPGLFVNGPLLSGNVVNGGGIWHVEHCGRIVNFAGQVADQLLEALEN